MAFARPATVETPSGWPHRRGRPVLVTTISVSLRLTTAVRVVVQASPRRSVTTIGVPGSWSLSGRSATCAPSSTAPQPWSSWRGVHPSTGGFCGSGSRASYGLSRHGWRVEGRGVVELPFGELFFEALVDQSAHPGGDVDGFFRSESVETSPRLRVDPEADGVFWRHAGILR